VAKFGSDVVSDIRDDRGNSALHMICGNGHLGG
jgi:ankyrin repeat protein